MPWLGSKLKTVDTPNRRFEFHLQKKKTKQKVIQKKNPVSKLICLLITPAKLKSCKNQ